MISRFLCELRCDLSLPDWGLPIRQFPGVIFHLEQTAADRAIFDLVLSDFSTLSYTLRRPGSNTDRTRTWAQWGFTVQQIQDELSGLAAFVRRVDSHPLAQRLVAWVIGGVVVDSDGLLEHESSTENFVGIVAPSSTDEARGDGTTYSSQSPTIDTGTLATQANYDAIEADDTTNWTITAAAGSAQYAGQHSKFVPGGNTGSESGWTKANSTQLDGTAICATNARAAGWLFRIRNVSSSAWETKASTTATSETTLTFTISASVSNYIDSSNALRLFQVSQNAAGGAQAASLQEDYVRMVITYGGLISPVAIGNPMTF